MFEDGIVKPRQHGFDPETSMYCFGGGGGGGGGGGSKSPSTSDDAYSNQQVTQPGPNTRTDSRGNTVNFNTQPAEVQSTPNYTKTLPNGVVVTDFSRPFEGQVNLSNQATPQSEPVLMSEYLERQPVKEDPLSYGRFLEDTTNIGNTLLGTPLGASGTQTITNAQQALADARNIANASPEMQALSRGYNAFKNQEITSPLGQGSLTVGFNPNNPSISYTQPLGTGRGNPLAEGIGGLLGKVGLMR